MSPPAVVSQKTIDASGLHCPQPVLRCMAALASMRRGEVLHLITTDPDAPREIGLLIRNSQHVLLYSNSQDQLHHFYIEKNIAYKPDKVVRSVMGSDLLHSCLVPG